MTEQEEFEVAWEEYAVTHEMEHPGTNRDVFAAGWLPGWDAAIRAAQEELVRRDQFSERTLRILDELMQERLTADTAPQEDRDE